MLPVVDRDGKLTARQIVMFTLMLVAVSLAPFFFGLSGWIFGAAAFLLGCWFVYESINTARAKTPESARRLLYVSVLYLPLLFLVMVLDKS
jgi:protoheme IX farnesyltransferase